MDVFDRLQARVLAYLKLQGVNTSEIRGTQMVKRLAGIYTMLYALICIYDVPGAIHAGKEFELSQLLDMIPYMYCTKQIAIFTMTQTDEVFLHPMRSVVLRGALTYAKFPYVPGHTIETYFGEDIHKTLYNVWRKDADGKELVIINPNYVRLEGEYRDICTNIAEFCDPKVGSNEVDAMLAVLSTTFIRVKPALCLAEQWYKDLTEAKVKEYKMQRQLNELPLQVVIRDFKAKVVYIAVEALGKLHEDLLMDAIGACMYSKWRPQAILTGVQARKEHPIDAGKFMTYAGVFQVSEITPEVVAALSVVEDFAAPDVTYIPPVVRDMFAGPRLHPDKGTEHYSSKRSKREKSVMTIDEDLDDWGCKQHHYRSACPGAPEASPAMQTTLFQRIRSVCACYVISRPDNLRPLAGSNC